MAYKQVQKKTWSITARQKVFSAPPHYQHSAIRHFFFFAETLIHEPTFHPIQIHYALLFVKLFIKSTRSNQTYWIVWKPWLQSYRGKISNLFFNSLLYLSSSNKYTIHTYMHTHGIDISAHEFQAKRPQKTQDTDVYQQGKWNKK